MNSFNKISRMFVAVLVVLAFTAGLASAAVPATRTITVGTGSGAAGQSAEVLLPITIDYPDAVGVGGIAFTIAYDPAALTFLGLVQATPGQTIVDPETYKAATPILNDVGYYNPYIKTAPYADRTYTTTANTSLFYMFNDVKDGSNNPVGQVYVAGASAEPLTGTTLFKARFLIKTAAVGGLTYPVRLFRSIIKNTAAGYSANGDFIPVLVGTGDKVGGSYTNSLTFPEIPATLVAGGISVTAISYSIGGKVTYGAPSNANAVGCTVVLSKETASGYAFIAQTTVSSSGTYSFAGNYPGNYKIAVQSLDPGYDNYESPSAIVLGSANITNADAVLPAKPAPARITGTVTGTIPSGLLVKVVDPSDNLMGTYTVGAGGAWSSPLLPALPQGQTYHWYIVYGSLTSAKDATTLDPNVFAFKSISGTLTGSGMPASGFVTATSVNGKLQKTVPATKDVVYTIPDLVAANDYIVSVVATGLPVTYYDAKTDISQATPVNISSASPNATGINFTFVAPNGHITGWIKNNGVGVPGITVYGFEVNTFALVQTATVAGTSGSYDLGVKAGTYEVFVIKPNGKIFYFYDTTGNGVPTQLESNAVLRTVAGTATVAGTNIDVTECDKTLTGKVTYGSATGTPAVNVLLSAFTATSRALGLTGQDGRYSVGGLCDGLAYTVEMKPLTGNYPVQSAAVTITGSNTTKNFIIDTGAVLSGTVLEEVTSNPINGAMIFLKDEVTGALVGGRVYFSANGVYSIHDVASGSYTLEVTHPDYQSYTVNFLVGSENMTQNVVLGKGAYLKGKVIGVSGNLAGATIIVTRAGATPVYTVTNSEGDYSVYGLDAAQFYIVIAQKSGYERQAQSGQQPATNPGTTVPTFTLTVPTVFYTVSGAVTTNAPAPLGDAMILVSSQSKGFFASTTTTAANGTNYSIPGLVNATDYQIVVIPPGNLPTQAATFTVANGNATQDFQFILGDSIGGTVSGPANGSLVYVFLYKAATYIGFVTTTNGSFSFGGLTAGSDYNVQAVASGYVSQWANNISSGNTGVPITLVAQ
jgi:large repetitive protein